MAKRKHNHRPADRSSARIPEDARYVNTTTLDDDMLERMCKLSESPVSKFAYLAISVLMIVSAGAYFFLLRGNAFTALLVAALGGVFLYERTQLSARTARKFGRQLDAGGKGARTRTMFFTPTEMGSVDADDGSTHSIPYFSVTDVKEDERMIALVLQDDLGVIGLDKNGFARGNAEDFGEAIRRYVDAAKAKIQAETRPRKKPIPGKDPYSPR